MTRLDALFQNRLSQFVREIGQYSQLIFNDHFSLVLFFLLAFAALYYRQLYDQIQSLGPGSFLTLAVVLAVLVLALAFGTGGPVWLTKDPDKAYLFAQGEAWQGYWLKGSLLSLLLPALVLFLASLLAFPLIQLASGWQAYPFWVFLVIQYGYKLVHYLLDYLQIFGLGLFGRFWGRKSLVYSLAYLLVMAGTLKLQAPYLLVVHGLILLLACAWVANQWVRRAHRQVDFNWVVERERAREEGFYKWVSMFVDVPRRGRQPVQTRYLDCLLKPMSRLIHNRYSYLWLRVLLRNPAYSGLWVRLLAFGLVLVLLTSQVWLVLASGISVFVLTLVQLLPLVHSYSHHPFQQIYPNRKASKLKTLQASLAGILVLQSLVLAVASLVSLATWREAVMVWGGWALTLLALLTLYMPWWMHRQSHS